MSDDGISKTVVLDRVLEDPLADVKAFEDFQSRVVDARCELSLKLVRADTPDVKAFEDFQ